MVFISVAVVGNNDGSMNGWRIVVLACCRLAVFVQNNIIIAIININVQSEVGWRALTISLKGERHTPYAIIKEKLFERQSMDGACEPRVRRHLTITRSQKQTERPANKKK